MPISAAIAPTYERRSSVHFVNLRRLIRGRNQIKEFPMKLLAQILPAFSICLALLAPGAQAADKDLKGVMMKDHEKMMSMQSTGKPDVDFAMMMREHHMSAVQMAQWQLEHGKDQKMKDMARKIIADQKKEIAQFDQFLAQAGHNSSAAMGASGGKSQQGQGHGHSK